MKKIILGKLPPRGESTLEKFPPIKLPPGKLPPPPRKITSDKILTWNIPTISLVIFFNSLNIS